jgi:hypothetical protein
MAAWPSLKPTNRFELVVPAIFITVSIAPCISAAFGALPPAKAVEEDEAEDEEQADEEPSVSGQRLAAFLREILQAARLMGVPLQLRLLRLHVLHIMRMATVSDDCIVALTYPTRPLVCASLPPLPPPNPACRCSSRRMATPRSCTRPASR